jgi:polynucleotide 5'-hydroxyl-kinase GRC3/NOL9
VLGIDASPKEIVVRAGKVLPFEASEDARVRIRMAKGGSYRFVKNRKVGVSIWRDVVLSITDQRPHCIMLVGANDTGKSTLAIYLSNVAIASGSKVSIVDGDVGQGDLAPPGCIGAARISEQLSDLRDVNAEHYGFIGATSPRSVEDLVIDNIKNIVTKFSAGSDICIVNTDGYIDEYGIDYKIKLAETLNPDLIVYLGSSAKVGRLLDKFMGKIMCVDAPERASKTHYEREKRRLNQYSRFLEGRNRITFGIKTKKFGLMGRSYDMFVANGWIRLGHTVFPTRFLYGMFIGLSSANNVKGFGIIHNLAHGMMTVKTRYEGGFDTVLLSRIRLSRKIRHEYKVPLLVNVRYRSE